jgi:hypothetical protein
MATKKKSIDEVREATTASERQEGMAIREGEATVPPGFLLTMEIDGLIAFIPSRNRDRMKALFVNAVNPESNMMSNHSHNVPPHYPFLSFNSGDASPNPENMEPDLVLLGDRAVRFLDWEDISLVYESSVDIDRGLMFKGGRRPGSAEPEDGEEQDFSWVAELERIDSEYCEVNPACLEYDPPRNLVIARLDLSAGEVSVSGVAQIADHNILWEFVEDNGSEINYTQALAEGVVWKVWIPADEVVIRFSRFGGKQFSDLTLQPQSVELAKVDVAVGNLPLESILGLNTDSNAGDSPAAHFSALYKVALKSGTPRTPQSVGRPGFYRGGEVTAGSTICLGITYKSSGDI